MCSTRRHVMRHRLPVYFVTAIALSVGLGIGCQRFQAGPSGARSPELHADTAYFLEEYCYSCHGNRKQNAGINFEAIDLAESGFSDFELWAKVSEMVKSGQMPPDMRPQPETDEVDELVAFLAEQREIELAAMEPHAGRVTIRRLNRAEYDNTLRDLLGVTSNPAAAFPPDDSGYGFDTIGDVLSLSPLLAEKYLDVAEEITAEVVMRERNTYHATTPADRHVFLCDHKGKDHTHRCAKRAIEHVASQAFRRPVTREEVSTLYGFYELAIENGDSFEQGVQLALQGILVSPHFLFRIERDRASGKADDDYLVGNYEYVTRLSYFLWSSMPDDELLACAADGSIRSPRVLSDQVRRMLNDPKSRALAENFSGQWLQTRLLETIDVDPDLFPTYNDDLRHAMAMESTLFFESIITEDRSILDFIDADYTYVNETLADHYGLDGVEGEAFQRVEVDTNVRGGILGQASVLTVTSYPNRTSPVIRGLWVLENVLADHPPPAPAGIPPLEEAKVDSSATLRQRLEVHRENPSCASCHDRIDPLGFGLENYNPIGAWRLEDNGSPIDNSGELPDGRTFSGPGELKQVLLEQEDEFARCLTKKLLTYSLGRGLAYYDEPVVEEIVESLRQNRYRFSTLIYEIVSSRPFKRRAGESEMS